MSASRQKGGECDSAGETAGDWRTQLDHDFSKLPTTPNSSGETASAASERSDTTPDESRQPFDSTIQGATEPSEGATGREVTKVLKGQKATKVQQKPFSRELPQN